MPTDIEIANAAKPFKINRIAAKLNLKPEGLEPYGHYKAKLSRAQTAALCASSGQRGKLVLVTAMTPTPAGEGKSTVSIGLADALQRLKKRVALSLREPSLGPCFGIKGGATGGGYSQIIPMDEINLNFTGDIHAVTAANNLLAAMVDNHIKFGNSLGFAKVYFKRCVDLNDRALRQVKIALGGKINGIPRTEGFNISVASEIMAILCLAESLSSLKSRLNQVVVGETSSGAPIFARDLHAAGAMAAILKDAVLPNLVQTLEHTPAFVHGGPFANIAHGTSSAIAAKTALAAADYVVTEAGFGADLGAEKFFDIFSRQTGLFPDAVVLVATVRALKMHGGVAKTELNAENLPAVQSGFANLKAHIANLRQFGANPVIALNRFSADTAAELKLVQKLCQNEGCLAIVSDGWSKGGKGCINLAKTVLSQLELNQNIISLSSAVPQGGAAKAASPGQSAAPRATSQYAPCVLYPDALPLAEKIKTVATKIYGASKVTFTAAARRDLAKFARWGYGSLPVCIAKTQNSISHDKTLLGAPTGYAFPITEVRLSAGAGFVVALSGEINAMPGLPRHPAAENIDIDGNGIISGLF